MPRFGPVVRIGWKRTHPPAMREALKQLDEDGTLSLVNKTKIARYFTLQVSIVLRAADVDRLTVRWPPTGVDETQ